MLFFGGLLSFCVCTAVMPIVAWVSWRIGAIDTPRDWRRMHKRSVPRIGGVAILFSVALCRFLMIRQEKLLGAAIAGAILVWGVGFCDDVKRLPAAAKLFIQTLAAALTVYSIGTYGGVSFFLSLIWILALTNAHNFIDGLDGLLGGTASAEATVLALLLLWKGESGLASGAVILLGACIGFLIYNHPPARIFAGDCGSGGVGFLLGTLSLPLFGLTEWRLGWLTPFFLFAYPITDLSIAVTRRLLRGKNPFAADRAHLHHRICAVGVSHATCTTILVLLSFSLGCVGLFLWRRDLSLLAMLASLFSAALMVEIRKFLLHFAQIG